MAVQLLWHFFSQLHLQSQSSVKIKQDGFYPGETFCRCFSAHQIGSIVT